MLLACFASVGGDNAAAGSKAFAQPNNMWGGSQTLA